MLLCISQKPLWEFPSLRWSHRQQSSWRKKLRLVLCALKFSHLLAIIFPFMWMTSDAVMSCLVTCFWRAYVMCQLSVNPEFTHDILSKLPSHLSLLQNNSKGLTCPVCQSTKLDFQLGKSLFSATDHELVVHREYTILGDFGRGPVGGRVEFTGCGQLFHRGCLRASTGSSKQCPSCR